MLNIFIELHFNSARMEFWKLCLVVKTKGREYGIKFGTKQQLLLSGILFSLITVCQGHTKEKDAIA